MPNRVVDVALGVILRNGQILICRRRAAGHLAGYWEFPGGKCELGESPVQALHRELAEEVGLQVQPVHDFAAVEHVYPEVRVRLHAFVCRHTAGDAKPHASDELQWVDPDQLRGFRFPEANASLLQQVLTYLQSHRSLDLPPSAP